MKLFRIAFVVLLIIIPLFGDIGSFGRSSLVSAEDEIIEDDNEATVESDEGGSEDATNEDIVATSETTSDSDETEEEEQLKPSPDAETTLLFVKPSTGIDFIGGDTVRLLVGFLNKGEKNFIVDTMDASFHYPQDYSYYIHNFTAVRYQHTVEPSREATFEYGFTPSEMFGARPFILTVSLNYHDADGAEFADALFNSTINITERDEGLDGETFFLYVFLVAILALALFGVYHLLFAVGKKRITSSRPKSMIETGTQNNKNNVDFDWIPRETLEAMNKSSPGRSPNSKSSPRQRPAAAKRRTGASDD